MIRIAPLAAMLAGCANIAAAQEFPIWERLLSHYSGKTDETPVPSMKMGKHMQMSLKGEPAPGDAARATEILAAADAVLSHYSDVETAVRDGYKPFFPTGRMGEEIHYTNYRYRRQEQQHVDYSRPGSILYKRTPGGLKAVGVMYTAPTDASPEQLNAIAPLSVATWHRHVDFCGGPRNLPASEQIRTERAFRAARQYSHRRGVQGGAGIVDSGGLELDDPCLSGRAGKMGRHGHGNGIGRPRGGIGRQF